MSLVVLLGCQVTGTCDWQPQCDFGDQKVEAGPTFVAGEVCSHYSEQLESGFVGFGLNW